MADRILSVFVNNLLPVENLVFRCCAYNQLHLIFYFDKQLVPVWLSFYKLYGMAHQLCQAIIIREFSLVIRYITCKRRVLFNMPCDINCPFHIAVIIFMIDIFFKKTFSHGGLQVIWKQKQQEVKQPVVLIYVGHQINNVREIQHPA